MKYSMSGLMAIFFLICLPYCIASLTLQAAERQHPYLFFNKKDIPALKAKIKDPMIGSLFARVCQRALNYNVGSTKILCAGIAFQLTGEKRYAEAGIKDMFQVLNKGAWFTGGAAVYHCDLGTAKKTLPIAYGYDLLHEAMTESQREEIKQVIGKHVFKPYLEAHAVHNEKGRYFMDSKGRKTYWTQCYFNWSSWINGDLGLMGLAMYDEHPDAKAVVEAARASLRYTHPEHNQGAQESGGWDEGPMYWGVSIGHAVHFYAALENVLHTDDGFFDLPGLKMTSQYILDFVGPDRKWVPFSDCDNRDIIDPLSEVYYLAQKYKDPLAMVYPENYVDNYHPLPFAVIWRPAGKQVAIPAKRAAAWYKDVHWAMLSMSGTQVAFKGGDLLSNHAQKDANSLLVYVEDELLLNDPGYGTRDTASHNTLLVNGQGQTARSNGTNRSYGGYSDSVAKIETCSEVDGGHVYLVSNATDCYSGLKSFRRHVILSKQGMVVVFDEVLATSPSTLSINWHPKKNIQVAGDQAAIFSGTKTKLLVQVDADQALSVSHSGRKMSVTSREKVQALRLVSVMLPGYERDPQLAVSYSAARVEVSVAKQSFVFKMGKFGYVLDAKAKAEKVAKSSKERTPREAKSSTVRTKPQRKQLAQLDAAVLADWAQRLQGATAAALAQKKQPYLSFMNKEYRVEAISESGTLSMKSGPQQIAYPFSRLKLKDLGSLATGVMELGGDDAPVLAAFYALLNGQEAEAQKLMASLPAAQREELSSLFKAGETGE